MQEQFASFFIPLIPGTEAELELNRFLRSHTVLRCHTQYEVNLTSQYFANHYLSAFDTLVSMQFPCAAYVRYMDDMVFWAANSRDLAIVKAVSAIWLLDERSLSIKAPVCAPCALGLPFLGFRILPGRLLLAGKTRRRYTSKLRTVDWLWRNGKISDDTAAKSASALAAMTSLARSRCFRHTATYGGGLGLEPGQSGWQLEQ